MIGKINESNQAKTIDLTGNRFGNLVVLGFYEYRYSKSGHKQCYWKCKCDCGKEKIVSSRSLKTGNVKSCGCLVRRRNLAYFTTHGMTNTRIYNIYAKMKQRCFNKNCEQYKYYGGRGITIFDEWQKDFQAFYDWAVANGYKDNLTIERKNVNGDYCPENCEWIPQSEQSKNRNTCHYITCCGETKTVSDWSKELHVSRSCIRDREKKFGSGEKAIQTLLNTTEVQEG